MYTHQLLELYKSFSKKEMMMLGKFLKSPYFNNRKMLLQLFQILRRFYPEFENKNLTKENLYKLLYGKAPYKDSTFRNLMSDLLLVTQNFLKVESLKKNSVESNFFLSSDLARRGMVNLYNSKIQDNEKLILSDEKFDSNYFLNRFKTESNRFYMNLMTKKVLKKSFVESESEKLTNGIVYLLNYFLIESIKHNDTLLKYSRSYNIKKNIDTVTDFLNLFNFDKLIDYIRNNSSIKVPVIEVYYNFINTFINFGDEKYHQEFKLTLNSISKQLGTNDNHFLYSRLIDYCVLKKNLGSESSFNVDMEIFDLQNIFIENEYYITNLNTYIPFDLYRNVLINSITVKKLSFLEQFINKYSKKLNPKHYKNAYNYSFALLNFEKGNYMKAMDFLSKIKFDQFIYKLDIKNLQLKINYELEQFESALSVIDTYKHFLKNNVLISESRRILHNNFIYYSNMLIQHRTGSRNSNLKFIEEKVKSSKKIFDKGWILEKIDSEISKESKKVI